MLEDKAAQRVEIAQDVLKQLATRKISAICGTFIDYALTSKCQQALPETEVQSILQEVSTCTVCAKGALFVATILRHDKYKVNDITFGDLNNTMYMAVKDFFTREQVDLIEIAFECFQPHYHLPGSVSDEDAYKAVAFGSEHRLSGDRLIAIMQNIIDNQGTFVP